MADERVPELSDLVERLDGGPRRGRRFRRTFVDEDAIREEWGMDFPAEDEYTEWRLRPSAGNLLELLDRSPQAADVLLHNFLLVERGGRKVVWFSRTHVIKCEGTSLSERLPTSDNRDYSLTLTGESGNSLWYCLTLKRRENRAGGDEDVLHLLHKVVALGMGIKTVRMQYWGEDFPGIIPGIQDLVSLPQSRRTVHFPWSQRFSVSTETGRILAYHCSPMVELEAALDKWEDNGEALAEALVTNQGPSRLAIGCYRSGSIANIAPALAATTCIEELTILLPMDEGVVWDAVSRNRGIRFLTARQFGPNVECRRLKDVWNAALTSGAIHRVHLSEMVHLRFNPNSETERRECSEMIATMIRSNPRITSIQYDPQLHDEHIMETEVMPVVQFNRFRPVVQAVFADGPASDAAGSRNQDKDVSALIGSHLVRNRPSFLYFFLRTGRNYVLSEVVPSTTDDLLGTPLRRASKRLSGKKRGRGCGS